MARPPVHPPIDDRDRPRVASRRHRVGAALHALPRRRRGGTAAGGDDAVRALVANPYTDIEDAHERLAALQACFEARADPRAVFLAIYERVTDAVTAEIDAATFGDPDWVADYLVTFANHYRRAVAAYERGDHARVPDAWQVAFDAATDPDVLDIQHAVLGINAHINYDLAIALDAVGLDPDRRVKYRDHRAVTDILRHLVDETQRELAATAPGLGTLDRRLGDLDERATVFTLAHCRDSAWRNAVAMHSRIPLRRRFARWVTHATATGIAHLVLSSRASVAVQQSLKDFETTG